MAQAANPLGILGHKKATPSADDLLSLKLLSETDGEFGVLKEESVLFLKNAMKMLASSPFLRTKFGGDGIAEASVLAELLKQRADTLNFQLHIDDMSRQLLSREFNKINMNGLRPRKVPVYNQSGRKYAQPVNMLGLRNPTIQDAVNANMAVVGSAETNAYGGLWRSVNNRGGGGNRVAINANDPMSALNSWVLRNDFNARQDIRADPSYIYG